MAVNKLINHSRIVLQIYYHIDAMFSSSHLASDQHRDLSKVLYKRMKNTKITMHFIIKIL